MFAPLLGAGVVSSFGDLTEALMLLACHDLGVVTLVQECAASGSSALRAT
jgi:hypothetical protein